jgi:hypothetical protein
VLPMTWDVHWVVSGCFLPPRRTVTDFYLFNAKKRKGLFAFSRKEVPKKQYCMTNSLSTSKPCTLARFYILWKFDLSSQYLVAH